jgi:hypothetical protein
LVVSQPAEAAEKVSPIVLTATYERELPGSRVADIASDIPEVLCNPE